MNRALFYVMYKTKKKNGDPYQEQDKIRRIANLLSLGADVNAQDKNDSNSTILHMAVQKGYTNIINFLVKDKAADYSIKDTYGRSVIDIVHSSGDQGLQSLFSNLSINIQEEVDSTSYDDAGDGLKLPKGYKIENAIGGGDCFFDAVRQGLIQLKQVRENFTVKSLREVCKSFSINSTEFKDKIVQDARNNNDPTVTSASNDVDDNALWSAYLASIEYTCQDINFMKMYNPDLYESLVNLKYSSTLQVPIWGRIEIEGQMICKQYNIRLHIIEKQHTVGWVNQIVDSSGSRSVGNIDYNEENVVHIVNKGKGHFEPILSRQKVKDNKAEDKVIHHKSDVRKFILGLMGINVSDHVLVDINISENPNDNKMIIVGRPNVLGSSNKQMRHITSWASIKSAVVSQIEEEQKDNTNILSSIIPNFMQKIIPLLTIKEGVYLSKDDFENYIKSNKKEILAKHKGLTSVDLYETKLETFNPYDPNVRNIYYLVNNHKVIESWKQYKKPTDKELKDAMDNYYAKWQKYIKFGMNHLNEWIQNNKFAVISAAELIARLIFTIFNQSKDACFAEEGNTLLEEIRVYENAEDAKKHNDNYTVYSHAKICDEYNTIAQTGKKRKESVRVRIVDNEGSIVQRASHALDLINVILSFQDAEYEKDILEEYIKEYNDHCKFDTTVLLSEEELLKYNEALSINNHKERYNFHVAKHLYAVFDFKPLEQKVLAPTKQDFRRPQVELYPSATGMTTECYSNQDGNEYREQCYKKRKGYNKHALFRNLLNDDETKDLLIEKIISHFFISLIPFSSLLAPSEDKEQNKELLKNTFSMFYTLVKQDYFRTSKIDLGEFFDENNTISQNAQKKWNKIIDNICTDDLYQSNDPSSILEHVEVSVLKTTITKVPGSFVVKY